MAAHCTTTTPTECVPCKPEHFTELWNYLSRCLYCSNVCMNNQEVEKECSPVSNRVCRCKAGYYWTDDFCIRHSKCDPGYGVKTKGTSHSNTVCEKCADGFFSNTSSALEPCLKHGKCASGGKIVLLPGSRFHDPVCGTCKDLGNGDEVLRTFLSEFFNLHRIPVVKLKTFVNRYIPISSEDGCCRVMVLPEHRGLLLEQIKSWLVQAPVEQLKRVPQMFRVSRIFSLAEKIEKRFKEIEQQSLTCSLTPK
ncbi:hypothetical protein LDENG_00126050 [Lucifuga dentata]|nr:hypothetical protein LDENG_00126050 [Lucifuga dentata]